MKIHSVEAFWLHVPLPAEKQHRSDFGHIEDEQVDALEHSSRGFAVLAVKGIELQSGAGVPVALPLDHVVLGVAPDAVLGPEGGRDFESIRRGQANQGIEDVGAVLGDRGLIADDPDPFALKGLGATLKEDVEALEDGRH